MFDGPRLADAPDVLTVEQTAGILAISRGTAYEGVRTGQIPSVRIGRIIRVPKYALEHLLNGTGSADEGPHENGAGGNGAAQKGGVLAHGHRTE